MQMCLVQQFDASKALFVKNFYWIFLLDGMFVLSLDCQERSLSMCCGGKLDSLFACGFTCLDS